MKQIPGTMRIWISQATTFALLAAVMSVGTAQAATVTYTLDYVYLNTNDQMTGTFERTYIAVARLKFNSISRIQ